MEDEDLSRYNGPTPWSNWVILPHAGAGAGAGAVLVGGYPASMDDRENDSQLLLLMRDCGVDCFVCLQSEVREELLPRACPQLAPPSGGLARECAP